MMMATLVKTGTEFDFKGSKATRDWVHSPATLLY
jgi:hypothetical protein